MIDVPNPFNKYESLLAAWGSGTRGVNVKNVDAIEDFIKDFKNSEENWEHVGAHIGFIIQAVENNVIINRGYPIGLLDEISEDGNREFKVHVEPEITWKIIESYKEYMANDMFKFIDRLEIELKPFFAFNQEEVDYQKFENEAEKHLNIRS